MAHRSAHSGLLSAGCGPGSLLAAAQQWQELAISTHCMRRVGPIVGRGSGQQLAGNRRHPVSWLPMAPIWPGLKAYLRSTASPPHSTAPPLPTAALPAAMPTSRAGRQPRHLHALIATNFFDQHRSDRAQRSRLCPHVAASRRHHGRLPGRRRWPRWPWPSNNRRHRTMRPAAMPQIPG